MAIEDEPGDAQTKNSPFSGFLANERQRHHIRCENVAKIVQKVIQETTLLAPPQLANAAAVRTAEKDDGHNKMMQQHHALDLFNLNAFDARLDELSTAFESVLTTKQNDTSSNNTCFIHALAVKANPVRGVLSRAAAARTRSTSAKTTKISCFGAECASYPEVIHALSLNFKPRHVIYDSPCKPLDELVDIISKGCYMNLDNLDEIDKVNAIFKFKGHTGNEEQYVKQFGLRINPVVRGGGSFAVTSTATTRDSKFGLALLNDDNDDTASTRERLMALYQNNPWLQGVHVHVGSQGCSLDMLVMGVQRIVEFALDVNAALGQKQIQVIDIGGGLPTSYDGNVKEAYRFDDYVNALHHSVPLLFSSGYFTIITEFGRSIFVKCGITISRVETVKNWLVKSNDSGNHANNDDSQATTAARIAVIHVGANQFLRTAYLPHEWKHCFSVFDSNGNPKGCEDDDDKDDDNNDARHVVPFLLHDIAGPMCFSGDYLAKAIWLPEIKAGDFLVIHDTGGYTMSMYSKYNSRCASGIYGYEYYNEVDEDDKGSKAIQLSILKRPETVDEALSFWGVEKPVVIRLTTG